MATDYATLRREHTRLKGNLTRAQRAGDPLRVVKTCREAAEVFGDHGWPDDWSRWARAEADALDELRRSQPWY